MSHPSALPTQMDLEIDLRSSNKVVRGRPLWFDACWYFFGLPLLKSYFITSSSFRATLLRLFGARVGKGVVLKPGLKVKFPWYLDVGDYAWVGEDAWIDNLAQVTIGPHACISQGVYLCTGNHDWTSLNMRLFAKPITCGRGSWVGARATVCPGVSMGPGAILAAGSVANKDIPSFEIHGGNPAVFVRYRILAASEGPSQESCGSSTK
jgi:putative colanic acid biosynthesis acetyltransferase WcaF